MEIGRSSGGGEFKYVFDTFLNVTVYPHPTQQQQKKLWERMKVTLKYYFRYPWSFPTCLHSFLTAG
jgi:hypothetical protein